MALTVARAARRPDAGGAGGADRGTLRYVSALSLLDLSLLALAASLVDLSKTALPGAGTLSVAVFAAVLPARQSTGPCSSC